MVSLEDAYVGMRVRAAASTVSDELEVGDGATGTVCDITDIRIGVEWDQEYELCHDCEGNCEDGHGWYCDPEHIEEIRDVELSDFAVGGAISVASSKPSW